MKVGEIWEHRRIPDCTVKILDIYETLVGVENNGFGNGGILQEENVVKFEYVEVAKLPSLVGKSEIATAFTFNLAFRKVYHEQDQ